MEMTGEYRIPAPRERVWAALNDPAILQACIPGCESLESGAANEFKATVRTRIGPVSARFSGKVTLSDFDPPKSYRISGEGQGGAAGFAKGGAVVTLEEDGAGSTILRYTADAQVGGKLAQIGSRLIDGTAKKLADEFFEAFAAKVQADNPDAGGASGAAETAAAVAVERGVPTTADAGTAAPSSAAGAGKLWMLVGAVIVAIVAAWLIIR